MTLTRCIQGAPRNMAVSERTEGRLDFLYNLLHKKGRPRFGNARAWRTVW